MLKFRKNELFWLKSWCFGCANSRKRRFQGRFSGGKRVESGVSLVKCVISVHVQLRSPTNVLLEKTQKNLRNGERSSCFYASNKGSGAACSNPSCRRECETGKNGARSTRNKGKNTSKEEKNKQKKTWNLAPKNWLRKQFFSANFATSDAEFRRVRFSVVPFSPKNCCPLAKNCTSPPKKSTLISNPYPVSRNVQSYGPTGHWRIGDCFGFFEIYRER